MNARSKTVYECWVCGALTNKLTFGRGMFGAGRKSICPQSTLGWHHKLEKKVELLFQPHPKSYMEELIGEILTIRRKYRSKIKNDLKGTFDPEKQEWMEHVRGYDNDEIGIDQEIEDVFGGRNEGLKLLRKKTL